MWQTVVVHKTIHSKQFFIFDSRSIQEVKDQANNDSECNKNNRRSCAYRMEMRKPFASFIVEIRKMFSQRCHVRCLSQEAKPRFTSEFNSNGKQNAKDRLVKMAPGPRNLFWCWEIYVCIFGYVKPPTHHQIHFVHARMGDVGHFLCAGLLVHPTDWRKLRHANCEQKLWVRYRKSISVCTVQCARCTFDSRHTFQTIPGAVAVARWHTMRAFVSRTQTNISFDFGNCI